MNSLRDEVKFLFSGQGMPYEKVSLMVAMVISFLLSVLLSGNFAKDGEVAIIDLDNSAYSRELINRIDASEYMQVTAVLNTPADPKTLMYQDEALAVVYFPQGLEKDRYTGTATNIGVYYDNTNTANTSNIKVAMNEIIGLDNGAAQGDTGSTNDSLLGTVSLADRELFNPQKSTSNSTTMGFLFFFGSMFFVFATIGMVPRLRLSRKLDTILIHGTPWELIMRILPYEGCLLTSWMAGLAVLRIWGDLNFAGAVVSFLFVQIFFVLTVGMLSLLFGWTAANPGIASSRMILFIPGGFILGGVTGPSSFYQDWVVTFSHVFPLTWEFHFTRDIILRGAGLWDIKDVLGGFMVYMAVIALLFCLQFNKARKEALERHLGKVNRQKKLRLLQTELSEAAGE